MAICRWTDTETDDNVLGSGADAWEWYADAIEWDDVKNVYTVDMRDPDDADKSSVHTFTRGKVRSTVTEVMMGKHNICDEYVRYFKDDDVDACAMDCVIQIIVYGKVVFS